VVGGLLSLGISVGLLAAKGVLPAFWDCCIHFNALYASDFNHVRFPLFGVLRHCKNVLPLAALSFYSCWRFKTKISGSLLVAWLFFFGHSGALRRQPSGPTERQRRVWPSTSLRSF
ncbi:MAG: hypothetical protein IKE64_12495, partial [Thermoguttaceae bacterium]|nr:hypothetical protein [Thermoguttaceae bacterium]